LEFGTGILGAGEAEVKVERNCARPKLPRQFTGGKAATPNDCHPEGAAYILGAMPITKYEGRSFTGQVFQLEECWFVDCILRECRVFYSGGSYIFENTTFENCQWTFQDQANQTVLLLRLIGLLAVGQTPPPQFQATSGPVN
jgi:hypothetical protein